MLPPELGAEPLRLLAARIDREELQQVLKILHLRRKLRAAVERERDQMPQRLRLGKHLGLLLGDQRKALAVPGTNSTGSEFSPREQGAGLVNVKNVVTTKASPAPTARRSGPSARITCARHSSSAPTASTARRSSATAGSAAHGTRRPKPMTATITLHCLRQWQSERLFMGIYTVVIFIELILGNALTKFVLSNTMKEKSKTRYENHIP